MVNKEIQNIGQHSNGEYNIQLWIKMNVEQDVLFTS